MSEYHKKLQDGVMFGIDLAAPGSHDLSVVAIAGKAQTDPEDPSVIYFEASDGLRLIFRDGEYAGFYTHTLAEALN